MNRYSSTAADRLGGGASDEPHVGRRALVLGANGGIGGEVLGQLLASGWQVRAMVRGEPPVDPAWRAVEWVHGDAMQPGDVRAAVAGCEVLVHAVNPPGYRHWADWVLPMIDHSIVAAQAVGATLLMPGSIYNYAAEVLAHLGEDDPQQPRTRKGAIRVQLEQRLADASARGLRVIIVRAGDFFGPRAGNNWFSQGLVKPGLVPQKLQQPGRPGVSHAWAYLPDLARTMVELLARREALPALARFHFGGHHDADGTQMLASIVRVVAARGLPEPRVKPFPWWLARLAAPFNLMLREVLEMRYLWQCPQALDNARLLATLGHEPHTPLDLAVESTLVGLGCLPPRDPLQSAGTHTATEPGGQAKSAQPSSSVVTAVSM